MTRSRIKGLIAGTTSSLLLSFVPIPYFFVVADLLGGFLAAWVSREQSTKAGLLIGAISGAAAGCLSNYLGLLMMTSFLSGDAQSNEAIAWISLVGLTIVITGILKGTLLGAVGGISAAALRLRNSDTQVQAAGPQP